MTGMAVTGVYVLDAASLAATASRLSDRRIAQCSLGLLGVRPTVRDER